MTAYEELCAITDVCDKFASREIGPAALEADLESRTAWVPEVWAKTREVGIPGLPVPEEYGGAGQPGDGCASVIDVISFYCPGIASVLCNHFAAVACMHHSGASQKAAYYQRLANPEAGEPVIGTVAFPPDTCDLSLTGHGDSVFLDGTLPLLGSALHARYCCLFINEEVNGRAVTGLVVDMKAPGVAVGENPKLPGLKVNPFAPVRFERVNIGPDSLLGEKGNAGAMLEHGKRAWFGYLAAAAIGAARSAGLKARAYASQRYQFGKIIIHHQEIQRMLGAMLMKIDVGTSAYLCALSDEKKGPPWSVPSPLFAKIYCTDMAMEVVLDAIQIHGGYGYMHEYGVEKLMRDCKVLQLTGGSNPSLLAGHTAANVTDIPLK